MSCPWPHKQAHPTKSAAKAHIGALWRDGKGSPDMAAYACPGSKPTHWHVGHDRRRFTKRIRTVFANADSRNRARNRRRKR